MPRRRAAVLLAAVILAALAGPATGAAQSRPKIELTPVVKTATVRAGRPVTIALEVTLPPDIHVQSDKPRDEAFFPTALVLTPPAGVTVTGTKYPPAVDFVQVGQPAPLAVFEKSFTVTATLALPASTKPGELVIPGRFDYQACDDKLCYRPIKTEVRWTLTVAP
jgi:uncharacterized protein (DUF58 family)